LNKDKRSQKYLAVTAGLILAVVAFYFFFFVSRTNIYFIILWLSSIFIFGFYFSLFGKQKLIKPVINSHSLLISLSLIAIFTPFYLLALSSIPYQVNTDEVVHTHLERFSEYFLEEPFGLSAYKNIPTLFFYIRAEISNAFGYVSLNSLRMGHAIVGLFGIVALYFFSRLFMPCKYAFLSSILLGSAHTYLAISRMAMRGHESILTVLLGLTLFVIATRRDSLMYLYIAGAMAGLGYYFYYSARILIFLLFTFLMVNELIRSKEVNLKKLAKKTIVLCVGFMLVVFPLAVVTLTSWDDSFKYPSDQLLIKNSDNIYNSETITKNIKNGLLLFFDHKADNGNVYINEPYGFVDPMTGLLLLIGILFLFFKKGKEDSDARIYIIGTFLIIWATLTLFINKMPHYSRMAILLPFIAVLTVYGIQTFAKLLNRIISPKRVKEIIIITSVTVIIVIYNLLAYLQFVEDGIVNGDDVGGTMRYIEARRNLENYTFITVSDYLYPYYEWNSNWTNGMLNKEQSDYFTDSAHFMYYRPEVPFTIFLNNELWRINSKDLSKLYPDLSVHLIKPDGSLLAVEVLGDK
jgi:hypothetical protein